MLKFIIVPWHLKGHPIDGPVQRKRRVNTIACTQRRGAPSLTDQSVRNILVYLRPMRPGSPWPESSTEVAVVFNNIKEQNYTATTPRGGPREVGGEHSFFVVHLSACLDHPVGRGASFEGSLALHFHGPSPPTFRSFT